MPPDRVVLIAEVVVFVQFRASVVALWIGLRTDAASEVIRILLVIFFL